MNNPNYFLIFVTYITKNCTMKEETLHIKLKIFQYEELNEVDRQLIDSARQLIYHGYAP